VGFSFSGAGGRISQHAALMSCLINGTYPLGQKIRPSFLAGASSGAVSSVMLSAVLQCQETGKCGITWTDYLNLLFTMDDNDVFASGPLDIAKILTHNVPNGYILDNTPFQKSLRRWLKAMNYTTLADLYIPTAISVVDKNSGHTTRLWSDDPSVNWLSLEEVIMASTALPIAFQTRSITGLPGDWMDGGTGVDTLPTVALLERDEVKTIYILVYNNAFSSGGATLPFPLNSVDILVNSIATINDMRVDLFDAGLDVVEADKNRTSFLYLPTLPKNYSVLDFSDGKAEYQDTYNWAVKNNPVHVSFANLNALRAQHRRPLKSRNTN